MAASAVSFQSAKRATAEAKGPAKPHVLVVEADALVLDYIADLLAGDYLVSNCRSGEEALRRLREGLNPSIVLLDCLPPDFDGLTLLSEIKALRPAVKTIMMSCFADPKLVVQAMRSGAFDFIQKPLSREDLKHSLQQCLTEEQPTVAEPEEQEIPLDENVSFVHSNRRMREIRAQCTLVSKVDLPVLILGESGTGKEVIAHYIHKSSPRSNKTFLKVNCAAMPADLLESELFGYEQGAFTGALKSKPGKFEQCNGGTILLDEIGEMPPALQAKLLHVLQDGTFSRLGSRTTMKVDVRVLAATNIDMKLAIAQRKFREDLFYRLNGFTISLPPLRERKDELPLLLDYFMRRLSKKYDREPLGYSTALMHACVNHSWPGNLRELENFVKRYIVLKDEHAMIQELMPARVADTGASLPDGSGLKSLVRSMKDDAEAIAISRALESTRWNRKQAAGELKISYKALLYKIRQYGLQPPHAL
ncbi:MAG TPA: sigma-54 dependent transcriptional regulator [Terriglobales bacterium]|jgi:DNA-binding NtrC family response regulator